ncbi:MAG: polysaccharide deacetylase [Clostridia bacterium]|nr:polysaccharide deacetylase [Clostridia bacterium]
MTRKAYNITFLSVVSVLVLSLIASGIIIGVKSSDLKDTRQTVLETQADLDEKKDKISELEKELEGEKEKNKKTEAELNKSNAERDVLKKENGDLKSQIQVLNNKKKGKVAATATLNAPPFNLNYKINANAGNKVCYLTFDDGPSPITPQVLNILGLYKVKATFFVINSNKYFDYTKRIVNEGHSIGIHTYTHNYAHIYASQENYLADFNNISNKIATYTGVNTKIMRFPGGSSNLISKKYSVGIMTALSSKMVKDGYVYFDWNVDSCDAGSAANDYKKIVNNVLGGAGDKASICVLMHDLETKSATVKALPYIIEGLSRKGYRFEALNTSVSGFRHTVHN